MRTIQISLCLLLLIPASVQADHTRVTVEGDQILLNSKATKVVGLRCSNALISDATTNDLIEALDLYQSHGLNAISVFLMGSRFGDVKGYLPGGSLNAAYRDRLKRILRATDEREMITIVGCLYWSDSKAKEELSSWEQTDADRAIAKTAKWLADEGFRHVILDPDNEGMAVQAKGWNVESMIRAAKAANPSLVVANNTKQNPRNEDLNVHFGEPEEGKPWFDSEATPKNAPGNYWGHFSKQSQQANNQFYNYSRIGRYTDEMKRNQLQRTRDEIRHFNGHMLASTWLQCVSNEGVGGPFTRPGGRSKLGSNANEAAAWNKDIDTIHEDAGILWWLEYVRDNFGPNAPQAVAEPQFKKRVVLRRETPGAFAIPKMVATMKGTLLIVYQDRAGGDWGKRIDPYAIRSTDGGKTWSKPQSLLPDDFPLAEQSIMKPTGVVVDRESGDIIVFISRSPLKNADGEIVHERWFYANIQETRRLGRAWFVRRSKDDGLTWSEPRDITQQLIKKPHWQEWSPVHTGLQLKFGEHRGRLVVPVRCYCPDKDPSAHHLRFQTNSVIFSDDAGETWTPGGRGESRFGECSIAERSDGSISMNQRVSPGEPGFRWTAISTDGGMSFLRTQTTNLTDQRCHAGLVVMRCNDRRVFVLSSVPGKQRKGLTISLSWDEGETWLPRRVVDVGHTAYSDLAVLPDNTIVCVYETGESTSRQHLAIAHFNLAWVGWSEKP